MSNEQPDLFLQGFTQTIVVHVLGLADLLQFSPLAMLSSSAIIASRLAFGALLMLQSNELDEEKMSSGIEGFVSQVREIMTIQLKLYAKKQNTPPLGGIARQSGDKRYRKRRRGKPPAD
jgi:hypothetical protein